MVDSLMIFSQLSDRRSAERWFKDSENLPWMSPGVRQARSRATASQPWSITERPEVQYGIAAAGVHRLVAERYSRRTPKLYNQSAIQSSGDLTHFEGPRGRVIEGPTWNRAADWPGRSVTVAPHWPGTVNALPLSLGPSFNRNGIAAFVHSPGPRKLDARVPNVLRSMSVSMMPGFRATAAKPLGSS